MIVMMRIQFVTSAKPTVAASRMINHFVRSCCSMPDSIANVSAISRYRLPLQPSTMLKVPAGIVTLLPLTIVGIFDDEGGEGEQKKIYVPITTAQAAFNGADRVNQIMFTVGDAGLEESKQIVDQALGMLSETHDFDPTDPNVVYVGSASGGLWKSTDGGDTWTPVTDSLPTLAVGAVCVLASDPDVVLIGTGEGSGAATATNVFGPYGAGILKSTDGGATWSATSLSYPPAAAHGFSAMEDEPATGVILAAATDGLYRSTDDKMIAGVCGGIAEYFGWDPTLVRVGYVLLSMGSVFFPGVIAYLVMMVVIPEKPAGS